MNLSRKDPATWAAFLAERAQRAKEARVERQDHPAEVDMRTRAVRDASGALLRPPVIVRATWRDPEDADMRSRTPPLVRGFKRHSVLERLWKLSATRSGLIDQHHVRAAERYLADAEQAAGGSAAPLDLSGVRGAPGPRAGQDPRAARSQVRLLAARAAIGSAACAVLDAVVLRNLDVKAWAATQPGRLVSGKRKTLDEKVAMGCLVAALTRLVEHYGKRNLRRSVFEEAA